MNTDFFAALDALEKEKGIPKEYLMERVEAALVSAFKKEVGGSNVRVVIDPVKADVKVFKQMEIVEEVTDPITQICITDIHKKSRRYKVGDIFEEEMKTKNFGRISAQTAKQVIIQGIREAERGIMIKEYEDKKEDIITAVVQKIDPNTGNVVVDTGTSYATLLKTEMLPGDRFNVGEHIKVFITEVRKESKGPLVTLSRTHSHFVKRLFELEVPEIAEGVVVIKGITREAGYRTKIAVMSREEGVDPIGSCIGARGIRINGIMKELGGEKIDVIKYSEDIAEYVKAALSPATVNEVIFDGERSCRVVVDADQLSLAIGKEGQNARLAARLTGCKIDIKTDRY
ncbi:MAG: transcription termination/antitermination protein NusA [Ruminococcaceae bacterium]|nr:transcription termination/antitermination protein NusA [Oscillospiraceae bacterium]